METYYTKEHEWVKVENGVGTIGITQFAADQLGDITFVELPKNGKSLKQFETFAAIESVKAASDIYSPVSGKVVAVNDELDATPEIVNESAEEKGWLAKVEIADAAELSALMTRPQYDEYLEGLEG